jgi:hypothetical protein
MFLTYKNNVILHIGQVGNRMVVEKKQNEYINK